MPAKLCNEATFQSSRATRETCACLSMGGTGNKPKVPICFRRINPLYFGISRCLAGENLKIIATEKLSHKPQIQNFICVHAALLGNICAPSGSGLHHCHIQAFPTLPPAITLLVLFEYKLAYVAYIKNCAEITVNSISSNTKYQ